MKNIQTLHGHTTASDGKLSNLGYLNTAEKYGVRVVAFTDHDALPDKGDLEQIKQYSGPTQWVMGIEISADVSEELNLQDTGSVHVVGLFVDPTNRDLIEFTEWKLHKRVEKAKHMVNGLQELGFDISYEEVRDVAPGKSIARPHVVEALKSKERNKSLLEEYIEEFKKEAESDERLQEKYEGMLKRGIDWQGPYVLFLSSDAYKSVMPKDGDDNVPLDEAVSLIRKAGGLAIFAHYYTASDYVSMEKLEEMLANDRLDGVETVMGLWDIGKETWDEIATVKPKLLSLAEKYNKVTSGGADIHKEEDFQTFVENEEYNGETIGMAERIIEQTGVDTSWSTFR